MAMVSEPIERATAAPVFVRGPWLLPSSMDGRAAFGIPGCGRVPTIGTGRRAVAATALSFVKRFA